MPEIQRVPLTKLVLDVKRLDRGPPKHVLSYALVAPNCDDIERTVLLLKEVGALTLNSRDQDEDQFDSEDGELTFAGRLMANLPVDIKLSKLILFGHVFGKLRECIILAAALSTKTFFTRYFKSNLEAFKSKWYWTQGKFCDFFAILNVYKVYEEFTKNGRFARREDFVTWCRSNNIDMYRIQEVKQLIREIEGRLKQFQIFPTHEVNKDRRRYETRRNDDSEFDIDNEEDVERHNLILKMIIAGAFYPNFFQSQSISLYDAQKEVCGKDVTSTVLIKNLPMRQGPLYNSQLTKLFEPCSKLVRIHYDEQKAYVEFKQPEIIRNNEMWNNVHTNVNFAVYLAVQMRLLRIPLQIRQLNDKESSKYKAVLENERKRDRQNIFVLNKTSSQLELRDSETQLNQSSVLNDTIDEDNDDLSNSLSSLIFRPNNTNRGQQKLPPVIKFNNNFSGIVTPSDNKFVELLAKPQVLFRNSHCFHISVSHPIKFGHFFAQISEPEYDKRLANIQRQLNSHSYELKIIKLSELRQNMLVAAYYKDKIAGNHLYRAQVLTLEKSKELATIKFIDYGNLEEKRFNQLFYLAEDLKAIPFQAFECKLANIKINTIRCPNGVWTDEANRYFYSKVENQRLIAKVFSIIENVVRVHLYTHENENGTLPEESLNQHICRTSQYALECDESQISKTSNLEIKSEHNNEEWFYVPTSHDGAPLSSTLLQNPDFNNNEIPCKTDESLVCMQHIEDELRDDSKYSGGIITINGPYSPLEVSFYSIVNIGRSKGVKVERDSINYVTLDDDPENDFDRILVASEVTLNSVGNRILLRKTCLMPKIRGLGTLCCLLFAPTVEVRVSNDKKRLIGALCGLGYDAQRRIPLYPDNDIECAFDIAMGFTEFSKINQVRLAINMLIGSEEKSTEYSANPLTLRQLQQKACDTLLRLVLTEREPVEKVHFPKAFRWNQIPKDKVCDVNLEGMDGEYPTEFFYKYHSVAMLDLADQ